MNTVQTIGENLSRIRKKHDLSQMQVAEFLGIKRELVSYYETGTRNIPLPHVHKLCDLFGISPINLLEGNESELTVEMSLNKMETKDLKAIASFKKIVMNYILLSKINDKTSGRSYTTHN